MEFLYFPENKLEYIPAVFSLIIVILIAILLMRLIRFISKRQEERFEEQYPEAKLPERHLQNQKDENSN